MANFKPSNSRNIYWVCISAVASYIKVIVIEETYRTQDITDDLYSSQGSSYMRYSIETLWC